MITPADIRKKALRHYEQWLERIAQGEADYIPLEITRVGDQKKADDRWEMLEELFAQSKNKIGYGYCVALETPLPNSKNKQSRVRGVLFDTGEDLLRFIGQESAFMQFVADCHLIEAARSLDVWRVGHAREIREYAGKWPQLLVVVQFFEENPSPGLPIRLLPIAGIDTKFIEKHHGILCQLLDEILTPQQPQQKSLAKRYGLPEWEPFIEIAWNDPALIQHFHGFSRMALPADQLARHPLPVQRVLVVENRNSMQQALQTPLPDTLVIFGGGFGVVLLQPLRWLAEVALYYWGDLDTHGLAILSHFRGHFPHVRPLLMDAATLDAHAAAWVIAPVFKGQVPVHLTAEEMALFERLEGGGIRLEQERVGGFIFMSISRSPPL